MGMAAGVPILVPLASDIILTVRLPAIEALGKVVRKSGDAEALEALHTCLMEQDNVRARMAITEALARIASPESIPVLRRELDLDRTDAAIRPALYALSALYNIALDDSGTEEAIAVMVEAVQKYQLYLGLRGYNLLGDLRATEALKPMQQHLAELERSYEVWREERDSGRNDINEEDGEGPEEGSPKTPETFWAFELGYNIARVDPEGSSLKLLGHDLGDVRWGAWMGLGEVGDVALLGRLDQERMNRQTFPFAHAAYRAINEILGRIADDNDEEELARLADLLPRLADRKAVCTRVEWVLLTSDKAPEIPADQCQPLDLGLQ